MLVDHSLGCSSVLVARVKLCDISTQSQEIANVWPVWQLDTLLSQGLKCHQLGGLGYGSIELLAHQRICMLRGGQPHWGRLTSRSIIRITWLIRSQPCQHRCVWSTTIRIQPRSSRDDRNIIACQPGSNRSHDDYDRIESLPREGWVS